MTLGEFSLVLSVLGVIPYLYGIIRGKVRPQRMSWFIWTVILALGLWSYVASGGEDSAWLIVGDLAVTAVVFGFSLWRGSGGGSRLDLVCLGIAIVGITVWQMTGESIIGVSGAMLADAVAMMPTLTKALREPMSESASTFAFSASASVCGILAVGSWNLPVLSYPAYLFIANFTTALTILVGQYQVRRLAAAVHSTGS